MKKTRNRAGMVGFLIVFIIVVLFSSCAYLSSKGNSSYEDTKLGDSRAVVIERFNMPFISNSSSVPLSGYAEEGCKSPCAERLWFPNRMSFGTEAWSVDFDEKGRTIDKYRWNSP
jgi:hypothetical protein